MTMTAKARYLLEVGQSIAVTARTLGVVDQTLFNWTKAHASAEQLETSRMRAKLARVKIERNKVWVVDMTYGTTE